MGRSLCSETALLPCTVPQTYKRSVGSTKAAATGAVDNCLLVHLMHGSTLVYTKNTARGWESSGGRRRAQAPGTRPGPPKHPTGPTEACQEPPKSHPRPRRPAQEPPGGLQGPPRGFQEGPRRCQEASRTPKKL